MTQTLEQPIRHFIRQDELHLDGHLSRKLVEMLAVEYPVTPETFERAKSRAAMHAKLFRIHEQPLVQKLMAMLDVVMHVKAQTGSVHRMALQCHRLEIAPNGRGRAVAQIAYRLAVRRRW